MTVFLAAASAIVQTQCHMGECVWSQTVSNEVVTTAPTGELRKFISKTGITSHRNNYPSRWSPALKTHWRTDVDYVLCSRETPAVAWIDRDNHDKWMVDFLDVFNPYGYNRSTTVLYVEACHHLSYNARGTVAQLKRLGYRQGTPVGQTPLAGPTALLDPQKVRAAAHAAAAQ